ncbi:DUF6507 family protein [Streptomyces sp. NPDC001665]
MTAWDIEPRGVQGQLKKVGTHAGDLEKALNSMVTAMSEAATHAGTAVPGSAASLPVAGPVAVGAEPLSRASTAGAAGDVHSSFGGLQAFYRAPEADQLFATTKPVADRGTSLRSELETITALWASDAENAAGFEPQDVGDDETYRAGLLWLHRLRTAHDQGLTPSEALRRMASLPDEDGSGRVDVRVAPRRLRLDALREPTADSR